MKTYSPDMDTQREPSGDQLETILHSVLDEDHRNTCPNIARVPASIAPLELATPDSLHLDDPNSYDTEIHTPDTARIMAPPASTLYKQLCGDFLFWIRLWLLVLSLFLLFLSSSYCIAQLIETRRDIVNECVPKTREEVVPLCH